MALHDSPPSGAPCIIARTDRYLVAFKPAGMHSAPPGSKASGQPPGGPSLAEWLFDLVPEAAGVQGRKPGEGGLMHRLDRDTSGLVLFALDDAAFVALEAAAYAGAFRKRYRLSADVDGSGLAGSRPVLASPGMAAPDRWKKVLAGSDVQALAAALRGIVIESRFRPFGPGSRRVACAAADDPTALRGKAGGGKAWTLQTYRTTVLSATPGSNRLEAEVELSSGFRHQIRAHFAWIGLPLAGDGLYGEGEGTLSLFAYRLDFPDPHTGEPVAICQEG